MTAAPLTPLEVRLEVSKCISNLSLDFLECPYDRRSIWERYVAGHVNLHVHGSIDSMRCCAWVAANPTEVTFKTTVAPSSDIASATHEMPVFIGIGTLAEQPRPIASVVRLQPLVRSHALSATRTSCDQKPRQFLEQRLQPGAEQRPRPGESALSGESRELACFHQVLGRDRDVVGNVVAHRAQPCLLRLGIDAPCPLLVQK